MSDTSTDCSVSTRAEWESADTSIATVEAGETHAVSAEETTITASSMSFEAEAAAVVTAPEAVVSYAFEPVPASTIIVGDTGHFRVNATEDGRRRRVKEGITSTSRNVLSLALEGDRWRYTGVAAGRAEIRLTVNDEVPLQHTIEVTPRAADDRWRGIRVEPEVGRSGYSRPTWNVRGTDPPPGRRVWVYGVHPDANYHGRTRRRVGPRAHRGGGGRMGLASNRTHPKRFAADHRGPRQPHACGGERQPEQERQGCGRVATGAQRRLDGSPRRRGQEEVRPDLCFRMRPPFVCSRNRTSFLAYCCVRGMLTERQLAALRASPPTNRVATALSLARVTQVTLAAAIGVTQAYVSDVARQRYSTITLASARKFTRFFGCSIDDLFPPGDEGDE